MLRSLPRAARWYITSVIGLGAATFVGLLPRAQLSPVLPLACLVALASLASAFKVQFPIASGSNMSVSYVVIIAGVMMRGPHAAMILGAFSAWAQSTLNVKDRNPPYRTLFNMSILVLTIEASGQVYARLGGLSAAGIGIIAPAVGVSVTYFLANTVPIAVAIALTTDQNPWRIWKRELASSGPSYLLGAAAVAIVLEVSAASGWWLAALLAAAPLYLTYKMYRAGVEAEARQGAILEAAHDAILTIDQQLSIREFNPAAEQMFRRARVDVLGRPIAMLLVSAERTGQLSALSQYLSDGSGPLARRRIELTCVRADAVEFPVELTVARLGSDSRAMITAFVRDLTERRQLEEQLRQSQKLEAIGRLAGGVAHDFNNILMSIMGAADLLLLDLPGGGGGHDEATEIKRSVQRGASLTRQLLAFSRRQATRPQLVALGDIVGGMDTMLRRLIGPDIDFEIILPSEPTTVRADPSQIEQVVLNLVVNARDAMPNGGQVTVKVDAVSGEAAAVLPLEGRAHRYARLAVSDTGMGMDDQTKANLFEPFFTTKEQGKGTGLGLSIVYGIVRQNGGCVTVLSEPGRGASFVIYLPAAVTSVQEPAAVPA